MGRDTRRFREEIDMCHPYKKYESSPYWPVIRKLIEDLEDNNDLELQTPIEYIVGYICKGLEQENGAR
ncbi:hypothetical protein [Prevotella sp. oral taxon 376]|uniref:hypothetical protein n=1 Tax=Prevotella sp. oral taxon 376 TaxID=712466 RepID=UPI0011B26147|nr:hypothetical protein [Prevotella sp. oral taxon 376]